jgi:hypothetical protein
MEKIKTVPIGGDLSSPLVAFGDDSQIGTSLAFAFVVVRRGNIDASLPHAASVMSRL